MKRTFLLLFLMTCIQVMLFAKGKSTQPNIILIFAYNMGNGDLSCYGSVWNQTPELQIL